MYLYCVLGQNFAKVLKLPTRVKIVLVDRYTKIKMNVKLSSFISINTKATQIK